MKIGSCFIGTVQKLVKKRTMKKRLIKVQMHIFKGCTIVHDVPKSDWPVFSMYIFIYRHSVDILVPEIQQENRN